METTERARSDPGVSRRRTPVRSQHSATECTTLRRRETARREKPPEETAVEENQSPDTHHPVCRMLEALSIGRHLKPNEQKCWLVVPLLLMSASACSLGLHPSPGEAVPMKGSPGKTRRQKPVPLFHWLQ